LGKWPGKFKAAKNPKVLKKGYHTASVDLCGGKKLCLREASISKPGGVGVNIETEMGRCKSRKLRRGEHTLGEYSGK